MKNREAVYILAGPLAVFIELLGPVYILLHYDVDFNQPISTLPYYHPETWWIFGIVLTTVGILCSVFALALRPYWPYAFKFSLFCSAMYIIAGWSIYNPTDIASLESVIHAGAANLAVVGYTFLLFQMGERTTGYLRRSSMLFFYWALLGMLGVTVSIHVFHANAAWFQIMVMAAAQLWILSTAWYLWRKNYSIT